jgi:hypothetical protein
MASLSRLFVRASLVVIVAAVAGAAGASAAMANQVQINNGYGACLDAQLQTINQNGTNVQLWKCLPGAPINQEWYIDPAGNGNAVLIRSADGGRCLDAESQEIKTNGTHVQLWKCLPHALNQEWLLQSDHIVNVESSRYLDATVQDIKSNGTPIQLWQSNGSPQQNWFQTGISGSISASPSALAVPDGQVGTTTISWSAPGAGAQLWMSVDGRPAQLFAVGASGSQVATIPPGTTTFTLNYGTDTSEHIATLAVSASPAAGSPASVAGPCVSQAADSATQLTATISPHTNTNPALAIQGFGQAATVTGTLTGPSGVAVPGALVCLVGQDSAAGAPLQMEGSAVTGAGGQFALPVPPGPSRTLWVVNNGAVTVLTATVQTGVRTRVTIHANHRHLRNRHVLQFRGSVPGPIPAGGVLVLVQVWRGTFWENFETTHAGQNGTYTARYRFKFTTIPTAYRMRIAIPRQSSYPYLGNHSRSMVIDVRP